MLAVQVRAKSFASEGCAGLGSWVASGLFPELGPPVLGEGSPTKRLHQKGTLVLTSLLEDLARLILLLDT